MFKSSAGSVIRLRGVRHNNLKNFDLDLPLNKLIVITGLSGSGKSSLAFDTLFAEGQRRYIETFSPYARQFFDRMDKPQVDSIEGIPPAIAIEQRNAVRTTRSTVGTMTEICDYMKMLWPHVAQLHCRKCGNAVRKDAPADVWKGIQCSVSGVQSPEVLVTFDLPLTEKLSLAESLALLSKQGYQRLLLNGEIVRIDEALSPMTHLSRRSEAKADHSSPVTSLTIIQDRIKLPPTARARFVEACEQAYHFGKGKLAVCELSPEPSNSKLKIQNLKLFSNRLHCADCDIEYRDASPALFSFNHPVGACPACKGFGRIISIDYNLAIPDRSKTLAQGLVKPWLSGHGEESQRDLLRACRELEIPTDIPFNKLPKKWQQFVIEGDPDYGKDEEHEWPRAWYGVKGYFRWLESKAYKMHVRVLLSRYRAYTSCPQCQGQRFQPDALLYRVAAEVTRRKTASPVPTGARNPASRIEHPESSIQHRASGLTLSDFYQLPVRDALSVIDQIASKHSTKPSDALGLILNEVRSRLGYLDEVGLGYLTLDRPTRSLSGGETERVNLTTCLGTRLVNTLFVLDEPSVGLHPRDTERLIRILKALRDTGNTVVVVEHEASVMRAADQIVDLGPGHGATGGQVVFQGSYSDILKSTDSLTGAYLSGRPPGSTGVSSGRFGNGRVPGRESPKSALRAVPLAPSRELRTKSRNTKPGRAGERRPFSSEPLDSPCEALNTPRENHPFTLNEAPQPCRTSADFPPTNPTLKLSHATKHNLDNLSVEIPLGQFVCVTGVSGSGKTTLAREVLLSELTARLGSGQEPLKASERTDDAQSSDDTSELESTESATGVTLEGWKHLGGVVLVDQSILGKTPRSNPAVYIGAFDDIREVFAQSDLARQRGLNASAFSFNSGQGQCERCRGAGFEKIEMQFLSDVYIRCPDCNGKRYRQHILEIKIAPVASQHAKRNTQYARSIAGVLDSTVEEAIDFLSEFADSRPAQRAVKSLKLLAETGLGYLKLGQPINTLSGGESQRLKLVRHLADFAAARTDADMRRTLFLFDEPTTGLHFDDVRVLLKVFHRLVREGHSVLVIEHNLDVIKSADWIIDLGPDAGDEGGRIVAQGTPEQIAACASSHTGRALDESLKSQVGEGRADCPQPAVKDRERRVSYRKAGRKRATSRKELETT